MTLQLQAGTFVQLTRQEFEDWLDSHGFRGKWKVHPRYDGVYLLKLSDTVIISINSTTGSREEVMNKGRASMKMRLVSSITDKVILGPKKLMGKDHFKRTLNWRDTWGKGLDRAKQTYISSKSFYDAVATIEDRDNYKAETLAMIESVPNWQQDQKLVGFRNKLMGGGVLTIDQFQSVAQAKKKGPERSDQTEPAQAQDAAQIEKMRDLYRAARNDRDQWTMDFVTSVAKQLKAGRALSDKQQRKLDDKLKLYRIK